MNFLNRCSTISSVCVLRGVNKCSFGQRFQNTVSCIGILRRNEKVHLYPTQQVCMRGFGSSCITRSDTFGDLKNSFNKTNVGLSYMYSFRFVYYTLFHDKNIKYHVGQSFADGAKLAFLYISECLANKNYEGLSEVVSPELLHQVKESEFYKEYSDVAKNVMHIKLIDMSWEFDRFTKEK